jgi:hypothetical protein
MREPFPKVIGLRLAVNPLSAIWRTPAATSELQVLLIGWVTGQAPINAGVPEEAAQILSESLTQVAVVTFLHSPPAKAAPPPNQWSEVEGGWITVLTRPAAALGSPYRLPLLATKEAGVARQLFDAAGFDWTQQGQMALLSKNGHPPPVGYQVVEQCFRRHSIADILRRAELGLLGILYPAADGDFASLVSTDPAFVENVAGVLRRTCDNARIPFAIAPEEEFKRTPWILAPFDPN